MGVAPPEEFSSQGAHVVIRPAMLADVVPIAATMRAIDREECEAFGACPTWALLTALDQRSDGRTRCLTVEIDHRPCAMFGVSPHKEHEGYGTIWMLGNDEPFRHVFAFARASKPWVQDLCKDFEYCGNYIWEQNTVAIAWLKWLGFEILDEPEGTLNMAGKTFKFFVGPDKPLFS